MSYLKEYDYSQKSNKRNLIKQYVINKLDEKWEKQGQESQKAMYFHRVLRAMNIDINLSPISILEIGGGNGDFMSYTHPNIKRKVMVDIDDYYKEKFKAMNIDFYCKDISKIQLLEVGDSSIDVVVLNHIIEHIDDIFFFMKEIKRVMKVGSSVYIRTPDIKKVKLSFYDDFTHIRPFSIDGLRHMMNTFGFEESFCCYSNNNTMTLEEFLSLPIGRLSFLGAKEIESVWRKNFED